MIKRESPHFKGHRRPLKARAIVDVFNRWHRDAFLPSFWSSHTIFKTVLDQNI